MGISDIIAIILISLGVFFFAVGSIGLIRLPDFYSRAHAQGKVDTLALILVVLGLVVFEGFTINSAKLLLIVAFVALTNPTGTNALTNAAYHFGLRPWFKRDRGNRRKSGQRK